MRLGMFMMPVHPPDRSFWSTLDEDTEKSLLAEQLGFDELWLGEHFSASTEPIPSPLMFFANLLAPDEASDLRHRGDQHPEPPSGDRRRRSRAVRPHEQGPLHARHRAGRAHFRLRTVQADRPPGALPHGGRSRRHDRAHLVAGPAVPAQGRVLGHHDQGRHQRQARRRLHAEAVPATAAADFHLARESAFVDGARPRRKRAGASSQPTSSRPMRWPRTGPSTTTPVARTASRRAPISGGSRATSWSRPPTRRPTSACSARRPRTTTSTPTCARC